MCTHYVPHGNLSHIELAMAAGWSGEETRALVEVWLSTCTMPGFVLVSVTGGK